MYINVYTYIYVYVYTYVCTYIYMQKYIHIAVAHQDPQHTNFVYVPHYTESGFVNEVNKTRRIP